MNCENSLVFKTIFWYSRLAFSSASCPVPRSWQPPLRNRRKAVQFCNFHRGAVSTSEERSTTQTHAHPYSHSEKIEQAQACTRNNCNFLLTILLFLCVFVKDIGTHHLNSKSTYICTYIYKISITSLRHGEICLDKLKKQIKKIERTTNTHTFSHKTKARGGLKCVSLKNGKHERKKECNKMDNSKTGVGKKTYFKNLRLSVISEGSCTCLIMRMQMLVLLIPK